MVWRRTEIHIATTLTARIWEICQERGQQNEKNCQNGDPTVVKTKKTEGPSVHNVIDCREVAQWQDVTNRRGPSSFQPLCPENIVGLERERRLREQFVKREDARERRER